MLSALKTFVLAASLFAPAITAAPLGRRAPSDADILVLQFAFTLESLEAQFYKQVLAKFGADVLEQNYANAAVAAEQLITISRDESAHQAALDATLRGFGKDPLQCQFNLDSALTDVVTAMTVARTVEMVGVGAYAGAAHIMTDPKLLTIAASILPTESRHQGLLNVLNSATAAPQSFEIPFNPEEVLAMAGPFISGCDLGIKANPSLEITADGPIGPGAKLSFKSAGIDAAGGKELFCQMLTGGLPCAIVLPINECVVPPNIDGAVAVFVTSDKQPLLGTDTIGRQGQADILVAGPNLAFVDFGHPTQALAQLVVKQDSPLAKDLNGAAPIGSTTTTTISPGEASSSISAAESSSTTSAESTPAAGEVTPAAGGAAPAGPTATIMLGQITAKMPEGSAEPAPAPSATLGSVDQLPINVGSAPSSSTDAGSAGVPTPTPEPAAGGASGEIIPIVPGAAQEVAGAVSDAITPIVPS